MSLSLLAAAAVALTPGVHHETLMHDGVRRHYPRGAAEEFGAFFAQHRVP